MVGVDIDAFSYSQRIYGARAAAAECEHLESR